MDILEAEAKRCFNGLVNRYGFSLRVQTGTYVHTEGSSTVSLPYLKPTAMLQKLLQSYPWALFGGHSEQQAPELLRTFWKTYQKEHPQHEVFGRGVDLSRVIPLTVHGDGGRTAKKQPLEVFSLQPLLGLESASMARRECRCEASSVEYGHGALSDPSLQCLNSKFNTYCTHFLIFAYPSKEYKDLTSNLLQGFIEHVCRDLNSACRDGLISTTGHRYFFAMLGFRLDMEWMKKVGSLSRSYMNVGTKRKIPCCHECEAGTAGVPFEDVNRDAEWVNTRFRTKPWNTPPPWRHLPFDRARPAGFLKRDPFHVFRLGILRNWLASSVFLLIFMGRSFV